MTGKRVLDVSFVVPTHDRVDLLAETIQSILDQTCQPAEILVVDNGTNNRAAAALAPFGNQVTLLRSTPHIKQAARNTGIHAATSTWIATLDDDDLLCPTYMEELARPMDDGRADIIGSDHRKFTTDAPELKTNFEFAPPGYWDLIDKPAEGLAWSFVGKFPLGNLLKRVPIYPSTTIIRREFALSIGGYDPRMCGIMAEDLEFLTRALTHGNLSLVWLPLVNYRLHAGNDTASKIGQIIGRWRIFEFVREHHADLPTEFRQALEKDLARRRIDILKLGYRLADERLVSEVAARIAAEDWTPSMRVRRLIVLAPKPVSRLLRFGIASGRRMLRT